MNRIVKRIVIIGIGLLVFAGCREKESDLLKNKLFFEKIETTIELADQDKDTLILNSRLTGKAQNGVNVRYELGGEELVRAYNSRFGKEFKLFPSAELLDETSSIDPGMLYAEDISIEISNLSEILAGDTYLLPVKVFTGDVPVIEGSDVAYFIVKKPLQITKAAVFDHNYIKVPITPLDVFTDVTYEAVVNISTFGNNNTVMGCEGVMIMRIGDAGGGTVPKNILQIAGKGEITWNDNPLTEGKWYHLAFTCASDGTACLYVNGEQVIKSSFTMSSDLTANNADFGFSIGLVPGFMWGERPFYGLMSEVRLWNVVRTSNQIKENMLSVDPKSDGLVAYYKLDGSVMDAVGGHKQPNHNIRRFEDLKIPIEIGGGLE